MSSDREEVTSPLAENRPARTQPVEPKQFRAADQAFIAWVDGAFADAAARSGPHLLCRPGCNQCCVGVFAIGPADRARILRGWADLSVQEPERALAIRARAEASWQRLSAEFPGGATPGILAADADEAFEAFGNDEVCPALDPLRGTCDLYEARPHTCRVFGPPVETEGGYGMCELCFTHATPSEIAVAAIAPEPPEAGSNLDEFAVLSGVPAGESILAFVLAGM